MHIESFYHQPTGTFTYVLTDASTNQCAIIDPVLDFDAAAGPPRVPAPLPLPAADLGLCAAAGLVAAGLSPALDAALRRPAPPLPDAYN